MWFNFHCSIGPTNLPNDKKSYLSVLSLPMRLDFIRQIKVSMNTKIISVGVKYCMNDLLFDVIE